MGRSDKERAEGEKRIATPLEAAYAKGGRAALERMKGVEPLFLMNWKIKQHNALDRQLEAHPADEALKQRQEKLLAEIKDINSWVKAKQREIDKHPMPPRERSNGRDMDMG